MTIGEIIKTLVKTENYLEERMKIGDQIVNFIKEMMPHDYDLFKEKEESYQSIVELINQSQIK